MRKLLKNRRLLIILLIVFSNMIGAGVVVPILPLYAEGEFGATAFQAAIFYALYHFAQFLSAPKIGEMSDRYGRRPVLIWSQIGTLIAFLLFIFAPEINQQLAFLGRSGLYILFFARLLDGITGGNITAAQAYIVDITEEEERATALGFVHSAFGSGLILGPVVGGVLAQGGFAPPSSVRLSSPSSASSSPFFG